FYEKIPLDTLVLDTIRNIVGSVVGNYNVYNFQDSISPYKYTFKSKGASNALSICANINPGYSFTGWSGSGELSENLTRCLEIQNGKETRGKTNIFGGGNVESEETTACTSLSLRIELHGEEYDFSTGGVHAFLNTFSILGNGIVIPVSPSSFTKVNDFLSY
ncbi:MAG: hypothetical protein RIF34_07540, partial [Candidatus Kapaibacterium sp.]